MSIPRVALNKSLVQNALRQYGTLVILPSTRKHIQILKCGWLHLLCLDRHCFLHSSENGLGLRYSFYSKFMPLLPLTHVHIYHDCHFNCGSSSCKLPLQKNKAPKFLELGLSFM